MSSTEAIRGETARLVREHVIREVDAPIGGATFDGRRLVLAAGNRLFRVMPDSGRVVDELETSPDPGGLAYDGRRLWQFSEGRIQGLDPRTGFVTRSIATPLADFTGLECIGQDRLVLHAGGRALARVEMLDGTPVAGVELGAALRGLAWIGLDLWSSTAGALCRIEAASARVVARVALPAAVEVSDLTADADGRIWRVDGRTRVVRAFVVADALLP